MRYHQGLPCYVAARFAGALLALLAINPLVLALPTTIVDNGSPSNRVDMVFLGDGYTQADLDFGTYDLHIQNYLDHMFGGGFLADPFPRYEKFFNVHKIDVVSAESGADIPSQGIFKNTALDATYDSFGINRLLTINDGTAEDILQAELAGTGITADMRLATVNHTKYGGSGGSWAVYAGGNSSAREIALHELGHSFSNLADEYVSYPEAYVGPEPIEPNVTADPSGEKWSQWLSFDDPRGSNLDIGAFEGAYYYATDVYRPSANSKMRSLNRAFDAVSREVFVQDIYALVDPLDDWLDNSSPLTNETLWVELIDPELILVEWYIDDVLVAGATGEEFDPLGYGFGPGTYSVRAHVYDGIVDHAYDGGLLDLVRTGLDALQQEVAWTLTITDWLLGDYNHDDFVDEEDFTFWSSHFGSTTTPDADGNGNGRVDAADYTIWRDHWGDSRTAGAAALSWAVPECGSGTLAMWALLLGSRFLGRRSVKG